MIISRRDIFLPISYNQGCSMEETSITPPKITRWEALQVIVLCAFPVHAWALVNLFWNYPSWVIFENAWGIIGLASYVLVFALFESLLAGGLVLLVFWLIPQRVLGRRLVALATALMLTATFFAVAHNLDWFGERLDLSPEFGITLGIVVVLLYIFRPLVRVLEWAAERLIMLSTIYLLFDIPAIIVVIYRYAAGW